MLEPGLSYYYSSYGAPPSFAFSASDEHVIALVVGPGAAIPGTGLREHRWQLMVAPVKEGAVRYIDLAQDYADGRVAADAAGKFLYLDCCNWKHHIERYDLAQLIGAGTSLPPLKDDLECGREGASKQLIASDALLIRDQSRELHVVDLEKKTVLATGELPFATSMLDVALADDIAAFGNELGFVAFVKYRNRPGVPAAP